MMILRYAKIFGVIFVWYLNIQKFKNLKFMLLQQLLQRAQQQLYLVQME